MAEQADWKKAFEEARAQALNVDAYTFQIAWAYALAAPTQGADTRPVAIIPSEWIALMEECATFHGKMVKGNWLSSEAKRLLATRDAAPSDSPEFRATVTALVSDMLTAWIADLPISVCGEISARANALLAGEPRKKA